MSNNLIAITQNLPDYLQNRELRYEDAGLGAGIAPRAPKLGMTTAKQWTITKDGKTMILPPDAQGQAKVRCVLIASAETITKAWYAKAYTPGSNEAPDCYSHDAKVPATGVKAPQCTNCAACPKNAFGSHPVTGRGKACSDRKMVVLVWEGMPDELMTWNVPTMSLQALRTLDTELRNANIPLQSVLVELSFDPAVLYPVAKISAVGFVDRGTAVNLVEKSRTAEISDLLREVDYEGAPEQQAQLAAPPVVPNQTVAFGQTAQQEAAPPVYAPQMIAPVVTTAAPAEQPQQRRRRRTKAEMEAARAAEAGGAPATQAQGAVQMGVDPAATGQLDWSPANATQQTTVVLGAQVDMNNPNVPEANHQPPTTTLGGLDVTSLLNKWKSA